MFNIRDPIFSVINIFTVKSLSKYKNKYDGSCFIIGDGPSIKDQDLSILENCNTFVTNRFVLNKYIRFFKKCNYCISDPAFLKENNKHILENIFSLLRVNSGLQLFVSNRYVTNFWFMNNTLFESTNFVFFRKQKTVYNLKTIEVNPKYGFYYANTIILDVCIPLAFYMGFKKIYLLGCESNYSQKSTHFYGSNNNVKKSAKDLSRNEWYKIVNQSYGYASDYFSSHGREIIDCSANSKITTLPKQKFSSIKF